MRRFWPVAEAAQADYEALREVALAGNPLLGPQALPFERRGLVGLIAWPVSPPRFQAVITGARRPGWTPHVDPRIEALKATYELLFTVPDSSFRGRQAEVH